MKKIIITFIFIGTATFSFAQLTKRKAPEYSYSGFIQVDCPLGCYHDAQYSDIFHYQDYNTIYHRYDTKTRQLDNVNMSGWGVAVVSIPRINISQYIKLFKYRRLPRVELELAAHTTHVFTDFDGDNEFAGIFPGEQGLLALNSINFTPSLVAGRFIKIGTNIKYQMTNFQIPDNITATQVDGTDMKTYHNSIKGNALSAGPSFAIGSFGLGGKYLSWMLQYSYNFIKGPDNQYSENFHEIDLSFNGSETKFDFCGIKLSAMFFDFKQNVPTPFRSNLSQVNNGLSLQLSLILNLARWEQHS